MTQRSQGMFVFQRGTSRTPRVDRLKRTGRTRNLEVLSNTALVAKRRCDERFRLRYLERLEPVDADRTARDLGSAVHEGIALQTPSAASAYILRVAGEAWPGEQESLAASEHLQIRAAVASAMVEGALNHWKVWPEAVEERFEVPLINPGTGSPSTTHRLGGRWDGLWTPRDPHPRIPGNVLLEVKTSTRVDRDYFARLRIDSQPTTYMEAVSMKIGRPVRRALYRIIRKPGIRRHRGESEQQYQERVADRAPLAPTKCKALAGVPKDAEVLAVEPGDTLITRFRRPDGTEYKLAPGVKPYQETDASHAARERAREAARAPLQRKVEEPVESYIARVRELYLGESAADYFFTEIVERSEEQMERWRHETWEEHLRILRIERGEMTIRNTGSCLDYGRCDYFDLCTGEVGPEAFRVRERVHPELSEDLGSSGATKRTERR